MSINLKNILYKYYLKNNLEKELEEIYYLHNDYLRWKEINYVKCSCCDKVVEKKFLCEICKIFYFCQNCWDDYTYYCFRCDKNHCFLCNIRRRACRICYYQR